MNTISKLGFTLTLFLLSTAVSIGQSAEDLLEKANKQYNLYAYNLAVRSYRTVLESDPNNPDALGKLADCYRQLNQPEESLKWYDRAASVAGANPSILLNYGKTLMSVGKYDEAKTQFAKYAEGNQAVGKHFLEMCDFAKAHGDDGSNFKVKNELANSPASDFGAAFFNNKVVFSSARTDFPRKNSKKETADWTGDAFNQLFVSSRDGNGFLQKPSFLKSDLENNYNEGPVAFSSNGEKLAFCRNNFMDGSRQVGASGIKMSLFLGELIDGKWANTKAFSYNGDYSTGYPNFSPDGKTLYFASDREGGYGGWDIYACSWNGKNWNTPENLGQYVNTPGDEITPFFDGATLFFSSDWHNGFGGMDIFRAETDGGEFKKITHLGPSVNSSRDDYGFIFDAKSNIGYLTSNRKGGKGNEDLWQINQSTDSYQIAVVSAGDRKPLGGAEIDFSDCGGKKIAADGQGKVEFSLVSSGSNCRAVVRKAGFESVAVDIFSGMKTKNIAVELKKAALDYSEASVDLRPVEHSTTTTANQPIPEKAGPKNYDGQYTGLVVNAETKGFLENVVVKAQPSKGPALETATDTDGRFGFSFEPATNYKITFSRAGFAEETKSVKTDAKAKDLGTTALRDAYSTGPISEKTKSPSVENPKTEAPKPVESSTKTEAKPEPTKTEPAKPEPAKTEVAKTETAKPEPPKETAPKPVIYTTAPEKQAETPKKEGFAVQIASIDGNVDLPFLKKYAAMSPFGNLYAQPVGKTSKVRVGVFSEKNQAEKVLSEAKKQGYKDAFVVAENGASEQLLVATAAPKPVESSTKTETKPEILIKEEKPKTAETTEKKAEKPEAEPQILVIANKKEAPKAAEPAPAEAKTEERVKRWCVQVVALANTTEAVDMSAYASLFETGNVYTIPEKGVTKVRIGVWETKEEADAAEKLIQKKGFKDAIAMREMAVYRTEKMLIKPAAATTETAKTVKKQDKPVVKTSEKSPYKVRVAALKDIKKYDATQFEGLGGSVEKKKEGKVLVVYLANFTDLESAIAAKNKAVADGFADAYVVKEDGGKMVKMQL